MTCPAKIVAKGRTSVTPQVHHCKLEAEHEGPHQCTAYRCPYTWDAE